VQENLTLTIDEEILRAAHKIAQERNTSVDELIREYLRGLAGDAARNQAALARFNELVANSKAEVGPITWTRDDLYDRKQW
jgi:hypothetical protein